MPPQSQSWSALTRFADWRKKEGVSRSGAAAAGAAPAVFAAEAEPALPAAGAAEGAELGPGI